MLTSASDGISMAICSSRRPGLIKDLEIGIQSHGTIIQCKKKREEREEKYTVLNMKRHDIVVICGKVSHSREHFCIKYNITDS